jgi:hypothetical protein
LPGCANEALKIVHLPAIASAAPATPDVCLTAASMQGACVRSAPSALTKDDGVCAPDAHC